MRFPSGDASASIGLEPSGIVMTLSFFRPATSTTQTVPSTSEVT